MNMQVDLFGEQISDTPPPAPYHRVPLTDLDSPGCADCRHVKEPAPKCAMKDWIWHCKLTHTVVDPNDGTCGRWMMQA
jgi:hypothetical protein